MQLTSLCFPFHDKQPHTEILNSFISLWKYYEHTREEENVQHVLWVTCNLLGEKGVTHKIISTPKTKNTFTNSLLQPCWWILICVFPLIFSHTTGQSLPLPASLTGSREAHHSRCVIQYQISWGIFFPQTSTCNKTQIFTIKNFTTHNAWRIYSTINVWIPRE